MKETIINLIKSAKGIVLGAHTNPDGDAIGALVGMATLCGFLHIPHQILLEKKWNDAKLVTKHKISSEVLFKCMNTIK